MGKYASKIVEQAKAWIGKKESDGSHKAIIDVYNAHKPLARNYAVKYTDAWCATFVSAVAIKCGYTDIIPTECSCEKMINLFKNIGAWVENDARTPCAGDVIFYDWDDSGSGDNTGWSDHVGIVEKVSGGTITVIEGNYSNAVKRRTLAVNGRYIRGYGVPKYDSETSSGSSSGPAKKSVAEVAKEVIAGKWDNGEARKAALKKAGYDPEDVQAKVNQLAKGTSSKKSITEIAKEVLAGKWGNGADRKKKLEAAGYSYEEVQAKVNELTGKATATPEAFKPYLVKKNCDVLNIRSGAGTNFNVVGQIDKNSDYKYTIVEEKAGKGSDKGWGKLKSGAGWIALDWVKKV